MAIQMKEWGMLRPPAASAQIPTSGIHAVARAQEGIAQAVDYGAQSFQQWQKQSESLHNTANFTQLHNSINEALERTDAATRQTLNDTKNDASWQLAWNEEVASQLEGIVANVPKGQRDSAKIFAQNAFNQASGIYQRRYESDRIEHSRQIVTGQIERAVEKGDAQAARKATQFAAGTFIPLHEVQEFERQASSRAKINHWQAQLQADPLMAIRHYKKSKPEELPERSEEQELLERSVTRAQKGASQALSQQLGQLIALGEPPPLETMQLAHEAGVLSDEQWAGFQQENQPDVNPYELAQWYKRIDHASLTDEEEQTALRLNLFTSNLPDKVKLSLHQRIERSKGINLNDRRGMSEQITRLYEGGFLGAPEDEMSRKLMARLMDEGMSQLAENGVESSAQWLKQRQQFSNGWVCYKPEQKSEA